MDLHISQLCSYYNEIKAPIITLQNIERIFLRVPNPNIPLYCLHPTIQLLLKINSTLK